METNREKLTRWEKESMQMFAGFVMSVWFEGQEYFIDSSRKNEVENMEGAEIRPFRLHI